MMIERAMHPSWTSNAYLVAEGQGGSGVLIDSNGVEAQLLAHIQALEITITHVLVTHSHADHVIDPAGLAQRFGAPVVGSELTKAAGVPIDETIGDGDVVRSGELRIEAIAIPGHCPDQLAFLVDNTDCFTADCLFKGTVGGTANGGPTGYADQVESIMHKLMMLPPDTHIHPGHTAPSTIGLEWDRNPFIRIWRALDHEGTEQCLVRGEPATLILFTADYDGTNKAWVRYPDGRDEIVGGSQIERK